MAESVKRESFIPTTLKEMSDIIVYSYKQFITTGELNMVPMMWGLPGIGKTEIVNEACQKLKRMFPDFQEQPIMFMVSTKDATDIGMPFLVMSKYDPDKKIVSWVRPETFDLPEDTKAILFFDELNHGDPNVQKALQQIICDRKIDNFNLPKGVMMIAAGNPASCNINAIPLSQPMMDRFCHFEIEPDVQTWTTWAMGTGINPDIVTFLYQQRPELFYDEKGMEQGNKAYATPRSWVRVSKIIDTISQDFGDSWFKTPTAYSMVNLLCQGLIGQSATSGLMSYLRDKARYQNPEEIYKEGKDFKDTGNLNAIYGCLIACVSRIPTDKSVDIKVALHNLATALAKLKQAEIRTFASKVIVNVDYLQEAISFDDLALIQDGVKE